MNATYGTILLKIARDAILEEFDDRHRLDKDQLTKLYPYLNIEKATFVTLLTNQASGTSELRGCIGSILARRSLIDDLTHNAKASAFHDPRFSPVLHKESIDVIIEVSVLSIPEKVHYDTLEDLKKTIIPYKHGVIIKKGYNRAVFLPDVWKKLPDFDAFFSHLFKKAGLVADCLESLDEIEIFVVDKYSENDNK